jgi:hypothetical protein
MSAMTAGTPNRTKVIPVTVACGSCPTAFAMYPVTASTELRMPFEAAMPNLLEKPFNAAMVPFMTNPIFPAVLLLYNIFFPLQDTSEIVFLGCLAISVEYAFTTSSL